MWHVRLCVFSKQFHKHYINNTKVTTTAAALLILFLFLFLLLLLPLQQQQQQFYHLPKYGVVMKSFSPHHFRSKANQ